MLKRRIAGRAHVTLCAPVTVKAIQESVLLGRVEIAEGMIWMQVESGSETADVTIPISNVAGIEWEGQEG
jgi:hypothetical protein